MSDTAMWEVAKRRADAMAPGDAEASSPLPLERLLDEIRLLGPDAFDAACCRSLLRVLAADLARREGATIDRDGLDDAVARFRVSRNIGQDIELTQFLAGNDMSAEDLQRLIATEELVRWACGQAGPDAFGGAIPGEPAEEQAAVQWYFTERRGTAVPDDLTGYAQSCGFPDEQAFRTAVRYDYRYTCL